MQDPGRTRPSYLRSTIARFFSPSTLHHFGVFNHEFFPQRQTDVSNPFNLRNLSRHFLSFQSLLSRFFSRSISSQFSFIIIIIIIDWRFFSRCKSCRPVIFNGSHQGFFLHISSESKHRTTAAARLHFQKGECWNWKLLEHSNSSTSRRFYSSISGRFCYTHIWQVYIKAT